MKALLAALDAVAFMAIWTGTLGLVVQGSWKGPCEEASAYCEVSATDTRDAHEAARGDDNNVVPFSVA